MHEVYIYIFYLLLKNFNVFFLVSVSAHSHSSLSKNVPDHLKDFFPEFPENPGNKSDWKVKIIWKSVGQDPVLILSPFNNQVWFPNTVHPVASKTSPYQHDFSTYHEFFVTSYFRLSEEKQT